MISRLAVASWVSSLIAAGSALPLFSQDDWYISTVAGNGVAGSNGDGLPALRTALYLPQDGAAGPDGSFYFSDWNNHRIRRLSGGIIETVAGTGELGDAADGPALESSFNHPTNVAFDHEGRLLIAAWHNSKVKRLDLATGLVENLAGTGARAFGGDGGPGQSALLDLPSSVAVDSTGNILISDQANFRIRLLDPSGTIRTICGIGLQGYTGDGGPATEAALNSPVGQSAPPAGRIDIDSADRIYIADTGNHAVRLIDPDGTIRTLAGTGAPGYSGDGGPAHLARLNTPSDVAVALDGTVYVADTMNNAIRRIATDGTISTVAGMGDPGFVGDGGLARSAKLNRPYGVGLSPSGDVYVADTHNHRLRLLSREPPKDDGGGDDEPPVEVIPCTGEIGSICTWAGTGRDGFNGDGRERLETNLYWPVDVEFTPSGRAYVLDWNNHMVREVLAGGTFVTVIGTDFVGDGPADESDLTPEGAPGLTVSLNHPTDVQELPDGDLLLMAWHNHKVRVLDPDTGRVRVIMGRDPGYAGDGGAAKEALVNQPPHGVLDAHGNLFFIDQRNQRVRVVIDCAESREEGIVQTVAGTGAAGFNGDGPALETLVRFPAGTNPEPSGGITIDAGGTIYFSDSLNHRIRRVEFPGGDLSQGVVTTIAGTGEAGYSGDGGPAVDARIHFPQDLELGPDGALYFADTNNHRVRRVDLASGIISTVAGTGVEGYSGDGGPAGGAQLSRPFGVAFDPRGDLYISDTFNSRIRKVKLGTGPAGPEPVFPAEYRDTYTEVRNCRFSIEHGGIYIRVLANEIATAGYLANADPLPVGSVVIKEEYSAPGCNEDDLFAWRVMRKEKPGFDPIDGDWHWQKVSADREVIFDTKSTCIGCHRNPECVRRDFMCTLPGGGASGSLDVVLEDLPSALLSVSGALVPGEGGGAHDDAAPFQVYAVGADPGDDRGPYVVFYDGAHWRRLETGAEGDLWWISDRAIDGSFYLSGERGLILRFDPSTRTFERHATPGTPTLFGIWGTDEEHIWAVGGDLTDEDRGGAVWFYDGVQWEVVEEAQAARPEGIPTLYKVWGRSASDIYASGRLGVVLHFNGSRWTQVPSNSTRPLFTIHGNGRHVVATGGFVDGVLLELEGTTFVSRTPPGALQLNGVFVSEAGLGAAAGIQGTFALRGATGWQLQDPAPVSGNVDFHAVWIDPVGGVWAVGGDLSLDLDQGVVAYAGSGAIGRQFEAEGPCRTGAANAAKTTSYERDIAPILAAHGCAGAGCHGEFAPASGYNLTSYESIFGPGDEAESLGLCNVAPGSPRSSYLLEKLGPDPRVGARMPFGGAPLSDAEIGLIRTWILEGAPSGARPPATFRRGDADADGSLSLTDAVRILGYLFLGNAEPTCLDSADADDDGHIRITDAIYALGYLFLGTEEPPPPFGECGGDPTGADPLGCSSFKGCEG